LLSIYNEFSKSSISSGVIPFNFFTWYFSFSLKWRLSCHFTCNMWGWQLSLTFSLFPNQVADIFKFITDIESCRLQFQNSSPILSKHQLFFQNSFPTSSNIYALIAALQLYIFSYLFLNGSSEARSSLEKIRWTNSKWSLLPISVFRVLIS
jgi:hypothetical protein